MSPLQVIPGSPRFKREWTRPICRKLRSLHQQTWGFTIFRTVCTPQSDVQFPLFLAKLDAYVKDSIDYELRLDHLSGPSTEPPFDSGPNEEMKRRYVNDVIEDPSLDGASIDEVRDAFTKWLKDNGVDLEMHQLYARHRVCIMVDEAVLNSVAVGPEDPDQSYELESVWVKVVEYLAPGEQEWQGWLKVGLNALYYFWFNVFAGEEVGSMFEATMDQGEDKGIKRALFSLHGVTHRSIRSRSRPVNRLRPRHRDVEGLYSFLATFDALLLINDPALWPGAPGANRIYPVCAPPYHRVPRRRWYRFPLPQPPVARHGVRHGVRARRCLSRQSAAGELAALGVSAHKIARASLSAKQFTGQDCMATSIPYVRNMKYVNGTFLSQLPSLAGDMLFDAANLEYLLLALAYAGLSLLDFLFPTLDNFLHQLQTVYTSRTE
ncbi:hypothetical protein V490_05083 [Pseudogymnoascus sp. VKM F-3557]|nr:hypothetical protein V490_05083 [Pseudogymnoascus sp. VKM F-3557]